MHCLCPGPIASGIARDAPPALKGIVGPVMRMLFRSPEAAARPVVYLACAPELAGDTGWYLHVMQRKQPAPLALDPANRARLWECCERLTAPWLQIEQRSTRAYLQMTNGTFVLADIGGYTHFLSDVGIEHAKEITSHLFNRMVEVDPERWKVGNVVGDCLFMYSDSGESPDAIFTYVRRVYESFRESIEEVAAGSTCRCGACNRSGDLALKFVVHGGEFDTQKIAGRQELIGSEIVVAHRLLKNSIPVREYALLTTPLADVAKASGLAATPGRDDYQDIGGLDYVYVDLQPVREAIQKSRAVYLTEQDSDVTVSIEIDAPPELVWRVVMNGDRATQWSPTLVELDSIQGEIGKAGSVHTCLHGDGMKVTHLTVAVDENRRRSTDRLWNVPLVHEMYLGFEVAPSAAGTKLSFHYALRSGVPIDEGIEKSDFFAIVRQRAEGDAQGLKALCEAEARALEGEAR